MSEPTIDTEVSEQSHHIHHRYLGPILGVLIIALALILGGLALWGSKLHKDTPVPTLDIPNNEPETPRATADRLILETTSPSDELQAIEADLSSTNLESLDAELTTIDAEMSSIFGD